MPQRSSFTTFLPLLAAFLLFPVAAYSRIDTPADNDPHGGGVAGSSRGEAIPGTQDTVLALIQGLKDRDPLVRESAAEALGKLGPAAKPAIRSLISSLGDEDPYVNGKAADALSRIGLDAVAPLVEALNSDSANVRWCAVIALGKIGAEAKEAIPSLVRSLRDKDANVRWCSTMALGSMTTAAKEAVPALVQCLSDSDQDVRWGAALALDTIDPQALRKPPAVSSTIATIDSLTPLLMKDLHVPGVSIALIHNRTLVWSRSYGITNADHPAPVTDRTLFEACSMTKPVFTCTVLKLVEQGKLDLDRPLVAYMEDSFVPDQPERRLITARMVLSHTTGLPNWRKGEEERDGPLPVMFKPGSKFSYSGEGMYYLQKVIEHITGEPLEVYAERTLFKPMGLKQMSYVWTPALDTNLAAGHREDGTFLKKTRYTHSNAAYTLYTTADEYARVLIDIMKTDRSAGYSLSQHSVDEMLEHQIGVGVREPIERPGRAMGWGGVYWGLGWSINETPVGDIAHHSGANRSGFRCFSQFNVAEGSGIVIMTNSLSGGELWTRLISRVGDL